MGDGSPAIRNTPVAFTSLGNGVTSLAGGGGHFLAVENNGFYGWGSNLYGQIGDGSFSHRSTPVPISGLSSGITITAAGRWHSLAVQNGALYAWGDNTDGELGNAANFYEVATPVAIPEMDVGITAIAAGYNFSLAVKNNAVYAWGSNQGGTLGIGSFMANSSTPLPVVGLTAGVTALSANERHSLAIQNGAVYAWGSNKDGELGDGTTTIRYAPVAVVGLPNRVTDIAAGNSHSLAIQNGNVYAWGSNAFGQLGDGTTMSRNVPELIDPTDLTNIVDVAAGYYASYALASDGTLWVWGSNYYGQLGIGADLSYNARTPQHLLAPLGSVFTSISAFGPFALATIASVPEPTSFVLLALCGTLMLRQFRRRAAQV